jgi:CRP/FNR family cyclic AMP-dependent transcriptional regulator
LWSSITGRKKRQAVQELELEESSKLELFSAMDILQDLPESEMEALMNRTPVHTAEKGTVFYGPSGPEVLFLLKSGKVEMFRGSTDGKRLTLAIIEPGTVFGEMSLIGQRMVGTCATAIEDSVICALSRSDVETLMHDRPQVALRIIAVLASRLQQIRDALEEMVFSDVTGRVAGLLLRMSGDGDVIDGYSHQNLAAMVGCVRESFTAVIDRFKESEALTTGRRHIEITDRSQLERVVSQ